jgi:predicted  nucleic acid-binding Zn-ribbon protein
MKRALALIMACTLLVCLLPCGSDAKVLDVGTKQTQSDVGMFIFSSGAVVTVDQGHEDALTCIADGNLSTGLDRVFPGKTVLRYYISLPYTIFIHNITTYPSYNGSASNYALNVAYKDAWSTVVGYSNQPVFVNVNCTIDTIFLDLSHVSSNHFYFNDVIIHYTPAPKNGTGLDQAIADVADDLNDLEDRVDDLEGRLDDVEDQIEYILDYLEQLNITMTNIEQNQQWLLENITEIFSIYDQLNQTVVNLAEDITYVNSSLTESITVLETELNEVHMDITNMYLSIQNLTGDASVISEIWELVNVTVEDVRDVADELVKIRDSILPQYNDTALQERVLQLEAENSGLRDDLQRQAGENAAMGSELENVSRELEDIRSLLEEGGGGEQSYTKEGEAEGDKEGDSTISLLALVLAIIGVIMAAAAVMARRKPPEIQGTETTLTTEPEPPLAAASLTIDPPGQQASPSESAQAPVIARGPTDTQLMQQAPPVEPAPEQAPALTQPAQEAPSLETTPEPASSQTPAENIPPPSYPQAGQ